MKKLLISIALALLSLTSPANEVISSPNGRLTFTFWQKADSLLYCLKYNDDIVVYPSQLGLQVDNHLVESAMGIKGDTASLWTAGMHLAGTERTVTDTLWAPLYGEQELLRDHYHQLTLHFVKGTDPKDQLTNGYNKRNEYAFDIIVRMYNEGMALRYHFPEAENGLFMHITADLTAYRFAPGAKALHEAWAQGPYNWVALTRDAVAADEGRLEKTAGGVWRNDSERPLLVHTAEGLYVALLEAAMTDFGRGKLRLRNDNLLQTQLDGIVDVITPYKSPWRVVMVADRAVELINNKQFILSLNEPCQIRDTDFIKPGRAFRSTELNKKSILRSIDFCQKFNIEYVELDAGWYGPEMKISSDATKVLSTRDFNMPEVCRYAQEKGVGVWLYVNQRALALQIDSLLPLYRQWGIKGIKFGFVQIGGQHWSTWLHDAVKKCARYDIMVDIHDEYRPTGWSRTYPNLLTQEGVAGNEEMPDARHNTILPYTRFLCGPADYTLCYFNQRVQCTKAHQLAMAAVYYSPLQFLFWYDRPNQITDEPELDFWRHCPTVWQQSLALDGEPGEWIAQARRSGNDWFVGVMNGTEPRTITLSTADFLTPGATYRAYLHEDAPELQTRTRIRTTEFKVKAGKKLTLKLTGSGGAAIRFIKQ